jgi:large subunit ribosomal protein L37Ae
MAKKQYGTTKRLGSRYGRTVREKLGKVELKQKKLYKCPYCSYESAKRMAAGIWSCKKCSAKFTSKAYSVEKFPTIKANEKGEE